MKSLLDEYWTWLRDRTTLRQVGEWVEITTPYLDRHNDHIQIYANRADGGIKLTDDGYIIDDLEQSGCKIDSPKRQELLKATLNGFGVHFNNGNLEISASPETFPLRKHNLVQAMLAVNDLFYLASPHVASLFFEDVTAWLDDADVRYTPNVKFTGNSGFDHVFDFVIPKSRRQPERILRAITHPTRDAAQTMAFAWFDTKEVRSRESRAYAVLNDVDQRVSLPVLDALRSYEVRPVLWSERESVREELAA